MTMDERSAGHLAQIISFGHTGNMASGSKFGTNSGSKPTWKVCPAPSNGFAPWTREKMWDIKWNPSRRNQSVWAVWAVWAVASKTTQHRQGGGSAMARPNVTPIWLETRETCWNCLKPSPLISDQNGTRWDKMGQGKAFACFCDFQRSRSLCFLACCQVEGEIFVPFSVLPFSQGDDLRHRTTYRLKSARDHMRSQSNIHTIFIQYSWSVWPEPASHWQNFFMDQYGFCIWAVRTWYCMAICAARDSAVKESFPTCENSAGVSNEAVLGIRFRHGATACHSLPWHDRWASLPRRVTLPFLGQFRLAMTRQFQQFQQFQQHEYQVSTSTHHSTYFHIKPSAWHKMAQGRPTTSRKFNLPANLKYLCPFMSDSR